MKCQTMPMEKRKGIAGRHRITCGTPADELKDAFLTGNGVLLAADCGNPWEDTILVRREELMSPQWPEPPKAPLIKDYLPQVRRHILKGEYDRAGELADMAAAQRGTPPTLQGNPSHPAIILHVRQEVSRADNYLHILNLQNSLSTTRWEDGGLYTRELFCSRADGCMALRFTAPKGRLRMTLTGTFPSLDYEREKMGTNDLPGEGEGYFDCLPVPPKTEIAHCPDGITLKGEYAYSRGGFAVAVRVLTQGGTMRAEEDGLHIENADEAVFLLDAKRYYETMPEDAPAELLRGLEKIPADFEGLLERHRAVHQPMFDRVSVDLGGAQEDYLLTTRELKEKQFLSEEIIPAYMEAMTDMGRFFLLNECGKFPPIYGHVNVNVNHQISAGNIGNLPEMMESFFRWIEWQLPDARENAQRILGARGFFIACHPDEESGRLIHFNKCWPHHYWISSSGWCLQPFLEHYYCTGDEEFLVKRLLPLYKELALLYEDFLTVRDEEGKRMFIPSYSPENFPDNVPSMLNINAVMDISVCREVFGVLLRLGVERGVVNEEEKNRWEKLVSQLPEYLFGEHGELKEWAYPEYRERYDHRHASQLYGAYPGDEFQPELDEGLYRAAFISNRMRAMGNESCHGVMHRAQAAARLKDSYLTEQLLRFTMESGYVTDAFTTTHNPYRENVFPDGQGALPAVLLECLLYSRPGFLEPLPALPRGSFRRGELRGMAARTFARIDSLAWDLERGTIDLEFTSLKEQEITLCCRREFERASAEGAMLYAQKDPHYHCVRLGSGQSVKIHWSGVKN